MADEPPIAEGDLVTVGVRRRGGAIVEAVRRLDRAGVGVEDIAHAPSDARRRIPHAHRPRRGIR